MVPWIVVMTVRNKNCLEGERREIRNGTETEKKQGTG